MSRKTGNPRDLASRLAGSRPNAPLVRVARGTVTTSTSVKAANCGVLAIGVRQGPDGLEGGKGAAEAARRYGVDFAATATRRRFTGGDGRSIAIDLPVLHAQEYPWRGL
ncbi:MAG: hypothetical protein LBO20_04570, partial [Bifidobacteriaceae bacterium]|nr:hypothetical protein [Bifidobacteriaceae bacterium]